MEEIYRNSDICVASTFEGSGIKLRVAESLRRELPVVSTEHCARGYSRISGQVLRVFHNESEAIAHLEELAACDREQLRAICRSEYQRLLSFEAGVERLRDRVSSVFDDSYDEQRVEV